VELADDMFYDDLMRRFALGRNCNKVVNGRYEDTQFRAFGLYCMPLFLMSTLFMEYWILIRWIAQLEGLSVWIECHTWK
jgi:hypothetical protein